MNRIAKKVVEERFGPDSKNQRDMLGSFIRHGLTQREAQSESLLQMYTVSLLGVGIHANLLLKQYRGC